MELHEIIEAKWVKDYIVELTFSNLRKGRIDLKNHLGRGIFKELVDLKKFKRFKVDAELGTLTWPNGADLAPEVLYQKVFGVRRTKVRLKAA